MLEPQNAKCSYLKVSIGAYKPTPPPPPQEGLVIACEQALWGALAAGQENEGELGTILWNLNICI